MESVEKMTTKKITAKVERVVLDNEVYALLENRLNEFNSKSANTKLNLKQYINHLLLKRCSSPLTNEEITEVNNKFYDPVLVAKMAYKMAVEAKKHGRQYTQDDMMKLYQTQGVSSESVVKKTRGRKKKTNEYGGANNEIHSDSEDSSIVESSKNGFLKNHKSDAKIEKSEDFLPRKSP